MLRSFFHVSSSQRPPSLIFFDIICLLQHYVGIFWSAGSLESEPLKSPSRRLLNSCLSVLNSIISFCSIKADHWEKGFRCECHMLPLVMLKTRKQRQNLFPFLWVHYYMKNESDFNCSQSQFFRSPSENTAKMTGATWGGDSEGVGVVWSFLREWQICGLLPEVASR